MFNEPSNILGICTQLFIFGSISKILVIHVACEESKNGFVFIMFNPPLSRLWITLILLTLSLDLQRNLSKSVLIRLIILSGMHIVVAGNISLDKAKVFKTRTLPKSVNSLFSHFLRIISILSTFSSKFFLSFICLLWPKYTPKHLNCSGHFIPKRLQWRCKFLCFPSQRPSHLSMFKINADN